jgi:hypothetical protein
MAGSTEPLVSVTTERNDSPGQIRIYADLDATMPAVSESDFDILLTSSPAVRTPWVRAADVTATVQSLIGRINSNPAAALMLTRVLKLTAAVSFDDTLQIESLSFSVLLGGSEFKAWRIRTPRSGTAPSNDCPLKFTRSGATRTGADAVTIWLANPQRLNPYTIQMRDALADALETCLIDPSRPSVTLRAEGRSFCIGGSLDEFGTATDLAAAHAIRIEQSASARLNRLGTRATVIVQGAAIGSGAEIAAAAHRTLGTPDCWFHLPELSMGLIPGAGGIASIPRRIGRQRTCFLVLSGRRIDARCALSWGLIDEIRRI